MYISRDVCATTVKDARRKTKKSETRKLARGLPLSM
jgi:hypothetical protein